MAKMTLLSSKTLKNKLVYKLKRDHWSNSKMVSNTKVNGSGQIDMVMGFNIGLMELNTMDFGRKIRRVVKGSSLTEMVMYMKANGKMIKHLGSEFIFMQNLKLNIKVTGKMI